MENDSRVVGAEPSSTRYCSLCLVPQAGPFTACGGDFTRLGTIMQYLLSARGMRGRWHIMLSLFRLYIIMIDYVRGKLYAPEALSSWAASGQQAKNNFACVHPHSNKIARYLVSTGGRWKRSGNGGCRECRSQKRSFYSRAVVYVFRGACPSIPWHCR